jgi:hypothetical protein
MKIDMIVTASVASSALTTWDHKPNLETVSG